MAGFYHDFMTTNRPDPAILLTNLRALDASAGYAALDESLYRVKKATDWTAPQIAAAQTVLDTTTPATPQTRAQTVIDNMDIPTKAILLTLLDELNNLRDWITAFKAATAAATSLANLQTRVAALPNTPDRTVPQAIQAVREKAGTL